VGVFVDADYATVMRTVDACRLTVVQLHGRESPELVGRVRKQGITVIKALFVDGRPSPARAADYPAHAFLVECAHGPLPGGNAMAWRYESVKADDRIRPLILAGGLSPETVSRAIEQARPDAVDVSSGVEQRPGVKSMDKVREFLSIVGRYRCASGWTGRSVFKPTHADVTEATG
jgi:phosphoribosylanthranilate isomerase